MPSACPIVPVFNGAIISNLRKIYAAVAGFASGRALPAIGIAVLFAVVALLYANPLKDNDLWWQMKIGEYLLHNMTLKPDHSIYSWTIADPSWIYNAWVPQMLLYAVYSAGGFVALHAVVYFAVGAAVALFALYLRASGQKLSFFHLTALLAVAVGWHFNSDLRPETFSFVLLNAVVFVYFYSLEKQRDIFWLYPVLMVVWVNTHGVFIFGMLFIAIAFAGELINTKLKQSGLSAKAVKRFAVSFFVSCPALFVTPYGWKWAGSILKSFTDAGFMRQAMDITSYKSVFIFAHPVKYALPAAVLVFAVLMLLKIRQSRRVDFALLGFNAAFIYFSFMYARSAYLYFPVWLYSIAWLAKSLNLAPVLKRNAVLLMAGFSALCVLAVSYMLTAPRHYNHYGYGLSEYMPDKVSGFLLKNRIEGRMFNTYEIGGYLLWRLHPRYLVFIDPRHGPYTRHLMDDYRQFELGNNFTAFTRKYPFDFAVVHITWNRLLKNFYFSPEWKLLFFDQTAAVFVKKDYDISGLDVDLKPGRFEALQSYDGIFYAMNLYFIMEDYRSAEYMLGLLKNKYDYGIYENSIESVERLLEQKKRERPWKEETAGGAS